MTRPYVIDPEAVHWAAAYDGFPVCWPMDVEEQHTSTREEPKVTCPDCLEFLESA